MESIIRDSLAAKLYLINSSLLDSDLHLIGKEYYLPNPGGTRSYIDILAQDDHQNYVVIEIKKTNQAARQAIHEVIKYVDSLQINKKCKKEEIIVLIASVEWKELIGPFSSFVRISNFTVKGIQIDIDAHCNVVSCSEVHPLNEILPRYISPIQKVLFFINKCNLRKTIKSHESYFQKIGIVDYVALILKTERKENFSKYAIYIAIQRQTKEEYMLLLSSNNNLMDEIISVLNSHDESEEEELKFLESNLIGNLGQHPKCDEFEIGYPDKLASMLEIYDWSIEKIIRHGVFKENSQLSDDKIISEMKGEKGSGNKVFHDEISSNRIEKIDDIKKGISDTLEYNSAWKSQIFNILDYYKERARRESFRITIKIYSSNNVILDLYANHSEKIPYDGFPGFLIDVTFPNNENIKKTYSGLIRWDGVCPNIDAIIQKYYDRDRSLVSQSLLWRGIENKNDYILEDMGCEYITLLRVYESNRNKGVYLMNRYDFDRVDNSSLNYLYVNDITCQFPCIISQINVLFENVIFMDV